MSIPYEIVNNILSTINLHKSKKILLLTDNKPLRLYELVSTILNYFIYKPIYKANVNPGTNDG